MPYKISIKCFVSLIYEAVIYTSYAIMSHISYLNMTFTLYFIPWVMLWFYSLIRCPLNRTFSSYMHINQLCSCLFVFLFKTSKPKISFKRVQARSHSLPYSKQHIPLDLDFKFSDIVRTLGGKNLKRECLIDPSILEELRSSISGRLVLGK